MKMPKDYITKFDELKVCFIHSTNDLYEQKCKNIMIVHLSMAFVMKVKFQN